ncbi:MAG: putative two-component system sensor kinase [Nocardioidaceae bacterium]|jgi:hypothetical protein|nr:putative two-component system sensor kinase [Nocardioidaceae bacterium]
MTSARLALTLAVVSAVTYAAGEILFLTSSSSLGASADESPLVSLAFSVMVLVFVTVGAVVSARLPANPIGWLFCAAGLLLGVTSVTYGYAAIALDGRGRLPPGGLAAAWVSSWSWAPALLAVPCLLFLLFPDGRPLSDRWRWVVPLLAIGVTCLVTGSALAPGKMTDTPAPEVDNPLGIADPTLADGLQVVGWATCLVCVILAAWSLVLRFRRSQGVERQQLKWFVWSAGLLPAFLVTAMVVDSTGGDTGGDYVNVMLALFLAAVPLAAGLAILRYRLYDIDLVINRTLVYGALTATLVVTYLGLVLVFRLLLSPVTGESELAVAGSTLAVAALFRPLRARVQSVVDRRFYRSRYDTARTLEGFSQRLRTELDLETLDSDLRRVVTETMRPAHVSLWLRRSGNRP